MQLLRDVARQARFAAMQPGQITQHFREQDADLQAFERAVNAANLARNQRMLKASAGRCETPYARDLAHHCEAKARDAERKVREIALQSEIILQRRFEMAQADRAMLRAMMAEAA
jgi:hypothetical protein